MSRQHLCSGYVATLSCIICISVATKKVCHDKGLLPLSLTSCCSFVLMLRHDFLVLSIFAVATHFSRCDKTLLCSAYSFYRDSVCSVATELLCIVLKPLSRHRKVCHDLVSLYSAYFYVATLKSMLRHRFISSALKYVATLVSFVAIRPFQQISIIFRNIIFLSRLNFLFLCSLLSQPASPCCKSQCRDKVASVTT